MSLIEGSSISLHRRELALPALFEHSTVARQWFGLALAVLVLAGLFALAVVVGRMPPFDRFVTDPLSFKRCLVAYPTASAQRYRMS